MSDIRDQNQLKMAQLLNDLQNIRQTQQSYGVPTIGDLFKPNPDEIKATIDSVHYMMRKQVQEVEFRQEVRQKFNKNEQQIKDLQEQLIREKQKNEKTI